MKLKDLTAKLKEIQKAEKRCLIDEAKEEGWFAAEDMGGTSTAYRTAREAEKRGILEYKKVQGVSMWREVKGEKKSPSK